MKKSPPQNFKISLAAWGIETGVRVVSLLPVRLRESAIRLVGRIYGVFPHEQGRALRENLNALLPLDEAARHAAGGTRVFQNFFITLFDFFQPDGLELDVPDREVIEKIRKRYGGVMVLTFHMGHWELGARVMSEWGWPVTAVYQPYTNERFKRLIESKRAPRVNFLPVGKNAATGVREALRRGDVVAMLGDHPFGEEGTSVQILGRWVKWPKGPVLLAARERAPIVVAVIIRVAPRRYRAIIQEPILPPEKVSRGDIQKMTQQVADQFGQLIKLYTDQWYRFRAFDFVSPPRDTGGARTPAKTRAVG